ncbi:hypothetical protein RclHR1_03420002 [Rhizophagus clarus]|uniref:F-box domain-containing protein n=1 Tax=Rhizophagus clarus TaxID=94130 RepID=A0A2Z6RPQ3_9GLOM|nr:hypothetical protein RclHR1_03420002 [Rhizophagus clarus]GES89967.1 hypothetical protein GLOIN_2v1783316 [Rhizophagus clarus]
MSNLNRDILYLIFKQLQDDTKVLYSCLSVNKTWCETSVPILWNNPWNYSLRKKNEMLFLNVIISHLSNASKNKIGEHEILSNLYQKLSFNYISYCRHLNLDEIQRIINENIYKKSIILDVRNEILNLFINENMKFTHLYMCEIFGHQINLIRGAELCFSEIEFLSCSTGVNDSILTKLIESCNSIKELKLIIELGNNNHGIIKLIEAQRKLFNIDIIHHTYANESFCKILENSLIKHASTIQNCKITSQPSTDFLSSFVNLKELDLGSTTLIDTSWNCLENLSLPFLQILKSSSVQIEDLTRLINNTNGNLIEIKIDYIDHDEINNKKLIQTIYQKCPNIKFLTLLIRNCNLLELEILLISCQHLNGFYILIDGFDDPTFDWDKLFEILTESSPTSLLKIIFHCHELPALKSCKLFFDNWKGRHPSMFLKIIYEGYLHAISNTLMEKYNSEGIIVEEFVNGERTEDLE